MKSRKSQEGSFVSSYSIYPWFLRSNFINELKLVRESIISAWETIMLPIQIFLFQFSFVTSYLFLHYKSNYFYNMPSPDFFVGEIWRFIACHFFETQPFVTIWTLKRYVWFSTFIIVGYYHWCVTNRTNSVWKIRILTVIVAYRLYTVGCVVSCNLILPNL